MVLYLTTIRKIQGCEYCCCNALVDYVLRVVLSLKSVKLLKNQVKKDSEVSQVMPLMNGVAKSLEDLVFYFYATHVLLNGRKPISEGSDVGLWYDVQRNQSKTKC